MAERRSLPSMLRFKKKDLRQILLKCKAWLSNCRILSLKTTILAPMKFSQALVI